MAEERPQLASIGSHDGNDVEKLQDHNASIGVVMAGVDEKQARKDKALNILSQNQVDFDPNSDEAKRVLRKIDRRIMPIIWLIYLLQLMDKNSLSFANIMGIRVDTHLTGSEYSWLGSIVYFGYLGGQIPVSYCMQRFPIAKYFGVMAIAWGVVVACHAACHNFASLAVVRFLLGFLEVCTAPITIYLTGVFYTKQEQVTRAAIWYTCSGFANIFGGFIAAGLSQAPRFKWQGLFILYGGITAGLGFWAFFFLASSPTECKFLTEREKVIALERVRANKTGTEAWAFNRAQLKEALLDIRLYLIFMLLVCTGLPNGGITAFGPAIIKQFGFTTLQSTLLNAGSGACTVVGTGIAWYVARWTGRTIAGIYTLLLAAVGCLMMLCIPESNYGGRYGGYILTLQYPICVLFIISFMTSSFGGTTKKVAISAAYQIGYAVGNIVGPQTFRPSDAPGYPIAKWTMFAFILFGAFLLGCLGAIHLYWNKKRDAADARDAANGIVHEHIENEEFADITDFKLRSFRYAL